jgi:hypothetical protein
MDGVRSTTRSKIHGLLGIIIDRLQKACSGLQNGLGIRRPAKSPVHKCKRHPSLSPAYVDLGLSHLLKKRVEVPFELVHKQPTALVMAFLYRLKRARLEEEMNVGAADFLRELVFFQHHHRQPMPLQQSRF